MTRVPIDGTRRFYRHDTGEACVVVVRDGKDWKRWIRPRGRVLFVPWLIVVD